jgi:hypothetical protein
MRRDPSCRETADVLTYHRQIRATLNEATMAAQRILFRLRQGPREFRARLRHFRYVLRGFSGERCNFDPHPFGVRINVRLDALDPQRLDPAIGGNPLKDGVN